MTRSGVPDVAQWVTNPNSVHDDMGLILTQWLKDLALLQAAAYVTNVAGIQCYCGCGIGQ